MSLDERLREILLNGAVVLDRDENRIYWSNLGENIAQIKVAFEAEGYVQLRTYNVPTGGWQKDGVVLEDSGPYLFDKTLRMTGQDWYGRFEKELDKTSLLNAVGEAKVSYGNEYLEALAAAKKAAGIE